MIIASIIAAAMQAAAPAQAPAPAPPAARSPNDAIAAAAPADWADVDPADLLLFEFDGGRSVVVQLAPQFAPDHIANIKKIIRSGHWANATIYRVADNWVTQWGAGEDEQEREFLATRAGRTESNMSTPAWTASSMSSGEPSPIR